MDAEALQALYGGMSEERLAMVVRDAALLYEWLHYHTHDSRRSDRGFPDIVLIKGDRILWRELKTQKGKLSPDQEIWRDRLLAAGADWAIWRPIQWGNDEILKELMR